jgi:hypothetical protein
MTTTQKRRRKYNYIRHVHITHTTKKKMPQISTSLCTQLCTQSFYLKCGGRFPFAPQGSHYKKNVFNKICINKNKNPRTQKRVKRSDEI